MKNLISIIGLSSLLFLSGCLETYQRDAVIETSFNGIETCYILHGYTLAYDHDKITWQKPFTPFKETTVFSSSDHSRFVYSGAEKTFTREEFAQAARSIGIGDISKCTEMF